MKAQFRLSAAAATLLCILTGCGKTPETEKSNNTATPAQTPLPRFGTMNVTPNSGSGNEQVFEIKVPVGDSVASLVGLLVNSQKLGENACYVYARPEDNTFLLVNDNGEGSTPMEAAGSIANQQCEVLREGSSVSITDGALTIKAHIRFKPAFSGFKRLYVIAYDQSQATDGLRAAGQWQIPGSATR